MQNTERRRHERWLLNEKASCYIDATRRDVSSGDMSRGGMFILSSTLHESGSKMAVILDSSREVYPPVYLVGIVVRHETSPRHGVGVEWVRAVGHSPGAVGSVVQKSLGFYPRKIVEEHYGDGGDTAFVYRFPPSARTGTTPVPARPAHFLPTSVPVGTGGPMTERLLKTDLRQSARLPAIARLGEQHIGGTITCLGQNGAFFTTDCLPDDALLRGRPPAQLSFDFKTARQKIPVRCECVVTEFDDGATTSTPGLDLEFSSVDEGDYAGILAKYVRWLHFNIVSGQ
jgi:hypothetical protein